MSMLLLNLSSIEKLNKHRMKKIGLERKKKRKYHMVKWSRVCRSNIKGGSAVKDLRKQNVVDNY
jgi:hypothetical protein